jgi:curved DNA-binding protein CbpA
MLSALALLLLAATARAQLPVTELTSIFPAGGKQASEFEVTITGNNLDEVDELIFSHPGITCQPKMAEQTEFDPGPQMMPDRFVVKIAGDVPLGVYESRAVGRFGVSNPRGFAVTNLNEVEDDGQNKSFAAARAVEPGTVVSGRVDANSIDYYKLALKKDQRVILDCVAKRLDSRMDSTLVVLDAAGSELAKSRDTMLSDAVLDFTAPADGEFTVAVYDYVYAGGNDYFYRLAIQTGPFVDFVFPPSGLGGLNEKYTVYGRNLPGGKPAEGVFVEGSQLEMVEVNIPLPGDEMSQRQLDVGALAEPRSALVDGYEYRFPGANPVRISFAREKVVAEQEPNDKAENAQKVAVPCEFVGQFYPASDQDRVEFEAKAGEVYNIEVIGHRIGLIQCDPYLIVERITKNEKGEEQVSRVTAVDDPSDRQNRIGTDFDTSTDDPSYRLEVAQDATYRISVSDNFSTTDTAADPRNVYRLTIRKGEADFRLVAIPEPEPQANQNLVPIATTVLRKGGTALMSVTVDRRDGFEGEITIGVEGLPQGVACPGAVVGGKIDKAMLVFTAEENAPAWAGAVKIYGTAQIDGKDAKRYARAGSIVWSTTNRQSILPEFRLTRDIAISVIDSETAPALVKVGDPETVYETCLGGKLEIPINIQRRGDFKLDVKLTAGGLNNDFKPKEVTLKGSESAGKLEIDINNTKILPGSYTFYLQGAVQKYKYGRNPDAIAKAEEEKKFISEATKKLNDELKKAQSDKDEAKVKELQDKLKLADTKNKDVDKKIADLKKLNTPKDVNLALVSTPIKLRIHPSAYKLTAQAPGALKQGEKIEIPVSIEKLFGFDEKVDLTLEPPKGASGFSPKNVSIDKGKSEAKIEFSAAANATPGEQTFTVRAKSRYNNFNFDETYEVEINVEAVETKK